MKRKFVVDVVRGCGDVLYSVPGFFSCPGNAKAQARKEFKGGSHRVRESVPEDDCKGGCGKRGFILGFCRECLPE